MEMPHVLLVHGESAVRHLVAGSLGREPVRLSLASNVREALALLERERTHMLVADLDMPGIGYEFVRQAATIHPLLGVVLFGTPGLLDKMPQRTPRGPVEYLPKPVTADSLRSAIRKVLDRQTRRDPACRSAAEPADDLAGEHAATPAQADRIIAASKAMRESVEFARRCAATDLPVLIQGEPDTGKELLAREIHRQSQRAAGPFVRLACGALRESELAATLFSTSEDARDGSSQMPPTLLERARGGTLFLENVSQLPPWSQAKLLYALQQGAGARGGANDKVVMDARVIASTVTDLRAAVAQRAFSPSLYYFLSVMHIYVPPLRYRPQDIQALVETYLKSANAKRCRQGAKAQCHFSEDALRFLLEYDWPGNTLQLASVVARAVLLADDEEIGQAKIAEAIGEVAPRDGCDTIAVPLAGGLKEIERAVVEAVIERCRGNKAAAARVLRLHRRTLYRMLDDTAPAKNAAETAPSVFVPSLGDCSATGLIDSQQREAAFLHSAGASIDRLV